MKTIIATSDKDRKEILLNCISLYKKGNQVYVKNNFGSETFTIEKELHVKTEDYYFLADTEESDENAAVKMYNSEMNLISDNHFAGEYLWEILAGLTDEKITFISDEMEYNRKEILKEVQEEESFDLINNEDQF